MLSGKRVVRDAVHGVAALKGLEIRREVCALRKGLMKRRMVEDVAMTWKERFVLEGIAGLGGFVK